MIKIWLTSDHHFGHKNIIEYCERPFPDIWSMNVALVKAWNDRVTADDVVLHLGDVTLIKDDQRYTNTIDLIRSLNGQKLLIPGNHDRKTMLSVYEKWGWHILPRFWSGRKLFVHKPLPEKERPNWCDTVIHGHSHGKFKQDGYIDVGVDAQFDYAPVEASQLMDEKSYLTLVRSVASTLCHGVIPNTFITCHEGENFCGGLCLYAAKVAPDCGDSSCL